MLESLLLLLIVGCSLSLTDAALCGGESPENVGPHDVESRAKSIYITQAIKAGTVRKKHEILLNTWDHQERDVYIMLQPALGVELLH